MNDPGFKSLQEVAVVGSVANFDKSCPADKTAAVEKNDDLTNDEKAE